MITNKHKKKLVQLEIENEQLRLQLDSNKDFIKQFIKFFNNIMGGHDNSLVTSKHINRVANMVEDFFRLIDKEEIIPYINCDYEVFKNSVILGAYLHDLGKFHISSDLLNKPDKLTDEEYNIIKEHPVLGSRDLIDLPLNTIDYNKTIINNIVLHHHSNFDGSGYPDHLVDYNIPYESRLVAIFDRLEALMSNRSYKKAYSLDESIKILQDENKVDKDILQMIINLKQHYKKYEIH